MSMDDVLHTAIELKLFGSGQSNYPLPIIEYVVDSSGHITHEGYAMMGAKTSDSVWRIKKYTYDSSGNTLRRRWSKPNQIFDNYASLTYS
jgi:hypothetical protein